MTKIEIVTDFVEKNLRVPTTEELVELFGEQSPSTQTKYRIAAEGALARINSLAPPAPSSTASVGPPPPAPPMEDNDGVELEGFTVPPRAKTPILVENGVESPITLLRETSKFLIYARTPEL